ncbi:MlaD family protein [Paracoccus sp. (in: a-proteobacteria)]|uniref:MlaD family protein n=1 Tax=Paracoccus sp. TaxID=267 RepID=UPI003A893FBE
METRANYVLIGAFTLAGFLGILGFLMWFARLEVNRQFDYYDVYFNEVSGLSVSSQVSFAGLGVGKVVDLRLSHDEQGVVRVRLELTQGTPVRSDSRASVDTSAVTGISTVLITPGSQSSPLLTEITTEGDPVIQSSQSPLQTLGQEAPELLARLNLMAERLNHMLGDDNQARVANILKNVDNASSNLDATLADLSRATDAVASAATDFAEFGKRLDAISGSAETALNSFAGASDEAQKTLATVNGYVAQDLTPLTQDLRQTSAGLRTEAERLGGKAGVSLGKLDTTLDSATATLEAGHQAIGELGPVFAELRDTLARASATLASLPDDLPQITAGFRDAATSAAAAFDDLRDILARSRAPVEAFTREGLPQYTRLGQDLRGLTGNISQLVTRLKRDPAQILRGPPTPEFRR